MESGHRFLELAPTLSATGLLLNSPKPDVSGARKGVEAKDLGLNPASSRVTETAHYGLSLGQRQWPFHSLLRSIVLRV